MRRIIILLFAAMGSLSASAQTTHEFSVNDGIGLSALNYKLKHQENTSPFAGEYTFGVGGDLGMSYTCIFGEVFGIHVGADMSLYNAKAKLDDAEIITRNLIDSDGDRFDLHSTLSHYTETQNALFVNIPVMIHIQSKGDNKFYAKAGVKAGIPVNCKYNVRGATLTNKAWYPVYENWLTMPEFAGFGTFPNRNSKGKLSLGVSATLAVEFGAKVKIDNHLALYIGAYFDYGLNDIRKEQPFANYTPDDYSQNRPAEVTTNSALPALTEKINLLAIGLKVRFAIK